MNYLDTLYRAFIDYRKHTLENHECDRQRQNIAKSNFEADKIEIIKTSCIIEEDWINEIEKGLVYVEKALKEERQFIRSNGEVVPIEKAKRVSKDSVEHLSKHSNLLTKKPEGGDVIPDQIYTVERLNDYAVYENRFLYMLLCYLRDFISLRYNKILELTNTYNGAMNMNKTVVTRTRKLKYTVNLIEEKKDDEYLKANNEAKDIISRIDLILKTVMVFLSTPLMDEVSKTPMLKPPITKTNVLKMNHNFKNAVALYDFVTSYDKDGYSVEKTVKVINPFSDDVADEFAEAITLASFLTYEHGLGIKNQLKIAYEEEEKRRKEEREREFLEQIKKLRRRIKESGESPEEYMLMLEKRNRALEDDSIQLAIKKREVERLTKLNEELNEKVDTLTEIIRLKEEEIAELHATYKAEIERLHASYQAEIAALHEKYQAEIAELHATYKAEIAALHEKYQTEINQIKANYEEQIANIQKQHAEEIDKMESAHKEEIFNLKAVHAKEVEKLISEMQMQKQAADDLLNRTVQQHNSTVNELNNQINQNIEEIEGLKTENVKLVDAKLMAMGRLNALRKEYGLLNDPEEFMSQEAFNEIELQYGAFKKFFKTEWKNLKKKLRKEIFSTIKEDDKSSKKKVDSSKDVALMQDEEEPIQQIDNQDGE